MAQPPKPLDYPISKIVMEHMRANKRYLLAACCPDLRTLHTQVPLKINHLILDTHGFTVDNVPHTLHTFVSNLNQIPHAWRAGIRVGLPYDIDRFGLRHVDNAIEGDIIIQKPLIEFEMNLRPLRCLRFEPGWGFRHRLVANAGRVRRRFEKRRARRARRRARAHTYLQYTLHTPVRYPEGIQLAEALRTLTRNFFAASEISVNVLEIPFTFGVLRLPRDLRFHVVSLKTGYCSAQVFNAISPIIRDPLQKLDIAAEYQNDPIFNHEILRTLPRLTLKLYGTPLEYFHLHLIEVLKFVQVVEVVGYRARATAVSRIAKHWINHPRPIGHKMLFDLHNIEGEFVRVQNNLSTTRATILHETSPPEYPYCGFKQVNCEKDLVFYMKKVDQNEREPRWLLVMEMVNVRSARTLEEGEA